ncbi:methyltransferase [Novosphingobium sp. TH158]|nr:methyltransferase [Novosphingobium sp. TH158]
MLRRFDVDLARASNLADLRQKAGAARDLDFLRALDDVSLRPALEALPHSQAQLRQDLFALACTGFRRNGFFVEFGATDRKTLSNTWLLEKHFGWTGILAEPARTWHSQLTAERSARIDFDCVWSRSGEEFRFTEAAEAELSTISDFAGSDYHAHNRQSGQSYTVRTVSFNDLLERHAAPAMMDYLSIDTEGSELEILSSLDFDRFRFRVITCEHNYTANRERIHSLLSAKGYVRKLEAVSDFDDWYVLA